MNRLESFYIDGQWVQPVSDERLEVINPATERPFAAVAVGSEQDVERAVAAARAAFVDWSQSAPAERLDLLRRILEIYQNRQEDMARAIMQEMGAPISLAMHAQAAIGIYHLRATVQTLENYDFFEDRGTTRIAREPIGVCALITPWNWPINQIASKVAPALATGCTMVLKPSELAPVSAALFAEILDEAGVPGGVFNLVQGDGSGVGTALTSHPQVDMVSFTGSTRAGIMVARSAADTVKRVTQELGGKSANIILDDADIEAAVAGGVGCCFLNTGQSCNAPTRLLYPESETERVEAAATAAARQVVIGDPESADTTMGPVVSQAQFDKIGSYIEKGLEEGARLVCGGPGRPEGLEQGYFVRPTVFSGVSNDMTIAREEIFGPVLCLIPYRSEAEAIQMANDTPYGLAAYVSSGDQTRARSVARQLRAGQVSINGAGFDLQAPFGGYKQSGNGREHGGDLAFDDYLELKGILGFG